jgi:hypothetical protein
MEWRIAVHIFICVLALQIQRLMRWPASCTRRRHEIVEMAVPPGNHPAASRDLDLRRTCSVRRKVRDPKTPGRTARSAGAAGGSLIMRGRISVV